MRLGPFFVLEGLVATGEGEAAPPSDLEPCCTRSAALAPTPRPRALAMQITQPTGIGGSQCAPQAATVARCGGNERSTQADAGCSHRPPVCDRPSFPPRDRGVSGRASHSSPVRFLATKPAEICRFRDDGPNITSHHIRPHLFREWLISAVFSYLTCDDLITSPCDADVMWFVMLQTRRKPPM